MSYPTYLLQLIDSLRQFPGVGGKTAERYAFAMLNWPKERVSELASMIEQIPYKMATCPECGVLIDSECPFCSSRASAHTLCLIASPKEVFAIEETGQYQGLYHVLKGLLSPIEGRGPEVLETEKIKERIEKVAVKEVILALDSTIEGDATSLYLKQELETLPIKVSRLAFGLPMGSPLDYVDGGTLAQAFAGRVHVHEGLRFP